ncbi:type II secretory pathway protein, partial [Edwardsiella tarda]
MRWRLLALLLLACSARARETPLTVWFDHAPLRTVLQAVAEFAGLNLILSDELNIAATVHIVQTPWPQLLDALAEMYDLSVVTRDGILLVQSRERAQRRAPPAARPA